VRTCLGLTKEFRRCRSATGGKFYCVRHRRRPVYYVVIAATTILLSYVSGLLPKPNLPWQSGESKRPSLSQTHNVAAENEPNPLIKREPQSWRAGEISAKPTAAPFAVTEALPDTVTVLISNGAAIHITMTLKTAALEKERFTGLLDLNGDRPITAYVEDGVFYVDATITDLSGHKVVQIKKNKVEVMPAGWDMNFSANAVEVVDASKRPIFQMIRKRATVIQIAGLFVGKGGGVFDIRPDQDALQIPVLGI
jgi:hypothetical protein